MLNFYLNQNEQIFLKINTYICQQNLIAIFYKFLFAYNVLIINKKGVSYYSLVL